MYFIQSLRLVGVKQNRIELARRAWHCQPVRACRIDEHNTGDEL